MPVWPTMLLEDGPDLAPTPFEELCGLALDGACRVEKPSLTFACCFCLRPEETGLA